MSFSGPDSGLYRLVLLTILTGACTGATGSSDTPPPFVVRADETELVLSPVTFCWNSDTGGVCVDGTLPDELPNLGTVEGSIEVSWPLTEWAFSGTAVESGAVACAVDRTAELSPLGNRLWLIEPPGPAGSYDIFISGRGPEGDVHAAFSVTTMASGDFHDAEALVEAAELTLTVYEVNDSMPATAHVTVVAGDGNSTNSELSLADDCIGDHVLVFRSDESAAASVLDLGSSPYQFSYELNLGDVTHTAQVMYVDQLVAGQTTIYPNFVPPFSTPPRSGRQPRFVW